MPHTFRVDRILFEFLFVYGNRNSHVPEFLAIVPIEIVSIRYRSRLFQSSPRTVIRKGSICTQDRLVITPYNLGTGELK